MLIGIHTGKWGRFSKRLEVYEKILDYNKIDHIRLDISDLDFWEKVQNLDLFVFHFENITDLKEIANTILPVIQYQMNIKSFPDLPTVWPYDDKIKEFYMLKQAGFPVIENYIFWNREKAIKWVDQVKFPVVFKLKAGAMSDNVVLVKNKSSARKIIKRMFGKGVDPNAINFNFSKVLKDLTLKKVIHDLAVKSYRFYKGLDQHPLWGRQKNYVIFQEFLPDNSYDTRITILGNRAFGFKRHNRKDDFRASGSGKKDYNPSEIDKRCISIAFKISEHFGFQTMAYDFLYDRNGRPMVCEMSYDYPTKGIYIAPGYWDRDLNWHTGHYWPQYLILKDILNLQELIQPEIEIWEENTLKMHLKKRFS